jgi:hypothetical protein
MLFSLDATDNNTPGNTKHATAIMSGVKGPSASKLWVLFSVQNRVLANPLSQKRRIPASLAGEKQHTFLIFRQYS